MLQPQKSESRAAHARLLGHISKGAVAIVLKEVIALVGKIGDNDIWIAVVIEVAEVRAHPGKRFAVLIVGNTCEQADFGERAISVVVVQEARHRIVGDRDAVKPSSS